MSVLSAKNIVKKYGEETVLDDISLDIETGKIYGLIGRNGAGKTTLLSILTAQDSATEGTVTFDGENVWENDKSLSHICYSRELSAVLMFGVNNIKVKEYLNIAKNQYINWDEDYAKKLIDTFGININSRICKLSKGMLSVVTIIVGLASKADITILDEPVAGLDIVAREQFYKLIIDEYANTGRTFVISTHIIEEAESLFEKVIIIDEGKVKMAEDTEGLLARAYIISGSIEEVDKATESYDIYDIHTIGRLKAVTVLADKPVDSFGDDVQVDSITLQNLIYAICSERKMGDLSNE